MHEDLPPECRQVDEFLREDNIVCEFGIAAARGGSVLYHLASEPENDVDDPVRDAVHGFLRARRKQWKPGDPSALILVADEIPENDERQKQIAEALRLRVYEAIVRMDMDVTDGAEQCIRDEMRRIAFVLMNDHPGVVAPSCKQWEPIVFAMGPRYRPKEHRRYAPRVILPVTLRADAEELSKQQPKKYSRTADAMWERSGKIDLDFPFYDELLEY